ncbi:MAG: Rrf2 family transcriptional regulator [Bacillota bacterium]
MQIKDIANETLVSPQYLEQILLHLKSHGYVKSKRGSPRRVYLKGVA